MILLGAHGSFWLPVEGLRFRYAKAQALGLRVVLGLSVPTVLRVLPTS